MSVTVARKMFNVDEYHEMGRSGFFLENDRVELLNGEIIEMSPIGSRHAACVNRLNNKFSSQFKDNAIVSVQNPIRLSKFSEPEPDIALLKPQADFYSSGHPIPEDVLLVIEVAETSADSDREIKLPLYAEAGIPEVWIIDLVQTAVAVYRQPSGKNYQTIERFNRNQSISPLAFRKIKVELKLLLG